MDDQPKYRYRDIQGNWHNCTPEEIVQIDRAMEASPDSVSCRIMGMDPGIQPVFSTASVASKGDGTYTINWDCRPEESTDHLSRLMVDLEKNLKQQMAVPGYLLQGGRRFGKSYYYGLMDEVQKTAQCSRNETMAFNLDTRECAIMANYWKQLQSRVPRMVIEPGTGVKIYRYCLWSGVIRGHQVEVNRLLRSPIRKPL